MQVAKHTPELAQLVVGAGGVGALVDYVGSTKGNTRLPGIMALGYIAAFTETLALSVIAEKGLVSQQPICPSLRHNLFAPPPPPLPSSPGAPWRPSSLHGSLMKSISRLQHS